MDYFGAILIHNSGGPRL